MTALREEVAREICGFGPVRDGETWGPATRSAWDAALRKADAVIPIILGRAAEMARDRHEQWRMPHPDDAKPGEVCDDISACRDIAAAIREIGRSE